MSPKDKKRLKDLKEQVEYLKSGEDPNKYLEALQEIVQIDPKSYETWKQLGEFFFNESNHSSAQEAYRNYLEGNKRDVEVWRRLSRIYYFLKNYPEAIECAKEALSINPKDLMALSNLDTAYLKNGDVDLAEELMQDMRQNFPYNFDTKYNMAMHFGTLGKWPECKRMFAEVIQGLNPGDWVNRASIIAEYMEWENYEEMLNLCAIAERHFPYKDLFKYWHGIALMETGALSQALEKFKSYSDSDLREKTMIKIAEVYLRMGDYERASAILREYIQKNGKCRRVREVLNKIEQDHAAGKIYSPPQKQSAENKVEETNQTLGYIGLKNGGVLRLFIKPAPDDQKPNLSQESQTSNNIASPPVSEEKPQDVNSSVRKAELFHQIDSVRGLIKEIDSNLPAGTDSVALREQKAILRQKLRELQQEYDKIP